MHEFPTIEEVLVIHEIVVREFGGPQELRDKAALESALMRPQLGYYNDLLEEEAAFMESLAMNLRLWTATSAPPSTLRTHS